MNRFINKVFGRKSWTKNLVISIVILVEIIVLLTVGSFAWVETVSSIKLLTPDDGTVDSFVYTEATIGEESGKIDLGEYFKKAGDMHFAPASSANGVDLFFPKKTGTTGSAAASVNTAYRKGTSSDKNTAYLSVSFKVKTDQSVFTAVDFFFSSGMPDFGNTYLNDNMRVSVTERSSGKSPVTKIYARTASDNEVVSSTSGATDVAHVEAFSSHLKGSGTENALFTIADNTDTKIVTVNMWLQKSDADANNALRQVNITNFGIISSLVPRHVTLIPGSSWEAANRKYYAWCWTKDAGGVDHGGKLFALTEDENGYYGFDYIGSFNSMVLIVANENCNAKDGDTTFPSENVIKQTVDTAVPNTPVDPYCFITSYANGTDNKSTVLWEIPATVRVAVASGQSAMGTVHATYNDGLKSGGAAHTSKVGNSSMLYSFGNNSSNSSSIKTVTLVATPTPNTTDPALPHYAIEGWYTDSACTQRVSGAVTAQKAVTAPNKGVEVTYYAKFKEIRTVSLHQRLDDIASDTTGAGTLAIGSAAAADTAATSSQVNLGSSVTLKAAAKPGYTLDGIFTQATGGTRVDTATAGTASVTASNDADYYAHFTTNSYTVTANAVYSTDVGKSNYTAGAAGGTVQVATETPGATSSKLVKYKTSVALTATADPDYQFVGWYDASGNQLSTNATYTYPLDTPSDVNVNARFWKNKFNVTAIAAYSADGTTYTEGGTGGTVQVGSSAAGATSTGKATYNGTVTLKAEAETGYDFVGWFATTSSTDALSSSTTYTYSLSTYGDVNVYAKFRSNTFTVTAQAKYSSNGSSYTEGSTGGTVKVGDSSAGADSSAQVRYNAQVSLVASPASGYEFVGWYDSDSTKLSGSSSYQYTLGSYDDVTVYARFRVNTFTVTAKAYYRTSTSGSYSAGDTGGTVQAGPATAGATSATSVIVNHSVLLRAMPAAGYIFDGWYSSTSATSTLLSNSESYTYTLSDYSAKNVYARFRKGDIYLTGWINKSAVTTNEPALKFTHGANADEYQLTYVFTNDESGSQYVTIMDSSLSGNNVYHPGEINSGTGVQADLNKTNTSANGDPKWKVDAPNGAKVTFTWNAKTKVLSWSITYRVYFKNNCNFSNVYVVLLNTSYWDSNLGSGALGYDMHQLTYDSTSGLYYYDIGSTEHSDYIAFTEANQGGYGNFYQTKAVYRSDFDVNNPVYNAPSSSDDTKNKTDYYNNGNWTKYS